MYLHILSAASDVPGSATLILMTVLSLGTSKASRSTNTFSALSLGADSFFFRPVDSLSGFPKLIPHVVEGLDGLSFLLG